MEEALALHIVFWSGKIDVVQPDAGSSAVNSVFCAGEACDLGAMGCVWLAQGPPVSVCAVTTWPGALELSR